MGGFLRTPAWFLIVAALSICPVAAGAGKSGGKPKSDGKSTFAAASGEKGASHSESHAASSGKKSSKPSVIPQVEFINAQIRQVWQQRNMVPSPPATDNEWCRRIYLDVLGRVPSVAELNRFLADASRDKRASLVDRLLGEEYVEEYARNMTTVWTNILVGRASGKDENRKVNREGLQQALRRSFQHNLSWDKFAYECVSAKGANRPGQEGFNGFTNFLIDGLAENGVQATAKTSQIFLGLQVQCTQCHNHPFNDWKQNQFWELNAFFRQTHAMRRENSDPEVYELSNENFAGEDDRPEDAVLFYELRNGLTKAAYPVFVDGTKLKTNSGYLDRIDRRNELARLVATSDYLGRAMVNREWGHLLGYGFTKPVDDMGPHNPPTHPELLDGLAAEFKKSSYDVKQLLRWIALSEAYGLSSRFNPKNKMDDPLLGEKPAFSHFYLRQMPAEELYESLIAATEAQKTRGTFAEQENLKSEWLQQFTMAFGTDENDEATTFNGTIPQALEMMNGDLVQHATSTESGSFLNRLATDQQTDGTMKFNYLYLAALSRKPTHDELQAAFLLMELREGDGQAALQDVWWALLNSNEFILNH